MNEMIERCIEASFNAWRDRMIELGQTDKSNLTYKDMSEQELEFAIIHAKAFFKAMREPTEEMIKAGELIGIEYGYISDHDYKSIWQRQIDEILK